MFGKINIFGYRFENVFVFLCPSISVSPLIYFKIHSFPYIVLHNSSYSGLVWRFVTHVRGMYSLNCLTFNQSYFFVPPYHNASSWDSCICDIFMLKSFQPALRHVYSVVQQIMGTLSLGVKRPLQEPDTHLILVPNSRILEVIPSLLCMSL